MTGHMTTPRVYKQSNSRNRCSSTAACHYNAKSSVRDRPLCTGSLNTQSRGN